MERNSLWTLILIISCLFVLVAPFGGTIDLNSLDPSQGIAFSSAPGTNFGTSVRSCDMNGDGTADLVIGSPGANGGSGEIFVILGGKDLSTVDLNNPASSNSGFTLIYSTITGFGTKVICLGDINSDNVEDLLIADDTQEFFYVLYGDPSYFSAASPLDANNFVPPAKTIITISSSAVFAGEAVGFGGNVMISVLDGSNYYAMVIFDRLDSYATIDIASSSPPSVIKISHGYQGDPLTFLPFGTLGDLDSNSFEEFAIGNLNAGTKVAIIFGMGSGWTDMDLSSGSYSTSSTPKVVFVYTPSPGLGLGTSVTIAGDVDGDGKNEIIVGAPYWPAWNLGQAFYIYSSALVADVNVNTFPSSQGAVITFGTTSGTNVGRRIYGGLSTEKTRDEAAFAICNAYTSCYIIFGQSFSGTFDLDTLTMEEGFRIYNSALPGVMDPMHFYPIYDANGDGYSDYLIGQTAVTGANGLAYIVYGPNRCSNQCQTCTGLTSAEQQTCATCPGIEFLYNGNCLGSCPTESYQSSSNTCTACNSNCATCDTSPSFCLTCDNSYPLFYASNNNCYKYGNCPIESYQSSTNACTACDSNCLTCATSSTFCTSCDHAGLVPFIYNAACYSSCPAEAPYSYLYICRVECPDGTAPDTKNICINFTPEAVKVLSAADEVRQISSEIMSLISSLSMGGIFSMRSQSVQGPVSYYIFLSVDYPANYEDFASSNYGSSNMPNPFKDSEDSTTKGRVESVNKQIEDQTLLANIGYSILLLLICILIIPFNDLLLALIKSKTKDYESKWYYRFFRKTSVLLRWSFLINQFVSKYQDLAFFSLLGVYNAGGGDGNFDTLNLVCCIIGLVVSVIGIVGVFVIIRKVGKKLESFSEDEKEKEEYTQDDFLGRRLVLYKNLRKDHLIAMLYPFFLMVRVFIFCFVTIFLNDQVVTQLVFLNLAAVLMLAYVIKYRPLEENGEFWMTLIYEIVAWIALLGVSILAIYNIAGGTNKGVKNVLGYCIMAANMGILVLNFISFYLEMQDLLKAGIAELKDVFLSLSGKKKKVAPEPSSMTNFKKSDRDSFFPPTESLFDEKGSKSRSPVTSTPSVNSYYNDEMPRLLSPNNTSQMRLHPFPSSSEAGSVNDKRSLILPENSREARRRQTLKKISRAMALNKQKDAGKLPESIISLS